MRDGDDVEVERVARIRLTSTLPSTPQKTMVFCLGGKVCIPPCEKVKSCRQQPVDDARQYPLVYQEDPHAKIGNFAPQFRSPKVGGVIAAIPPDPHF